MSSNRPPRRIVCICCGETGNAGARGLRWTCYARHKRAGTLQQFQLVGRVAAKRKKAVVGPGETVIPLALLGALLADASPELEERIEQQLGLDIVTLAINAAESANLAVSA